jgi:hypothetical protein
MGWMWSNRIVFLAGSSNRWAEPHYAHFDLLLSLSRPCHRHKRNAEEISDETRGMSSSSLVESESESCGTDNQILFPPQKA